MASVSLSTRALGDVERLRDFLLDTHPADADPTVQVILSALAVLAAHPLIGRPDVADLRELVISRGRSGYLALYEFDPIADLVTIVAIRHQREAGFEE